MTIVLRRCENEAENSRAPSYFSQFFEDQLRQNEDGTVGVRTLYIDRDPVTFQDISRHLQGMSSVDLLLQKHFLTIDRVPYSTARWRSLREVVCRRPVLQL